MNFYDDHGHFGCIIDIVAFDTISKEDKVPTGYKYKNDILKDDRLVLKFLDFQKKITH